MSRKLSGKVKNTALLGFAVLVLLASIAAIPLVGFGVMMGCAAPTTSQWVCGLAMVMCIVPLFLALAFMGYAIRAVRAGGGKNQPQGADNE